MQTESKYPQLPDNIRELLLKSLNSIMYGAITLTIQDGRIVQIESSEKIRVAKKK